MLKTIFWIWLILVIIGLVVYRGEVNLGVFVQEIKNCFRFRPISTIIVLIIIVMAVSSCNDKSSQDKGNAAEDTETSVVPEKNMPKTESAVADGRSSVIETSSSNNSVKKAADIAGKNVVKESMSNDVEEYDVDEYDNADEYDDTEEYGDTDEYDDTNENGYDSTIWSTDYLFWHLKEYDFSKIENLVEVAEEFWSKKDELEANNDPVSVKLNSKVFSADYYSLTSERSNYVYVGDMEDNRPSGFGVLSLLFEDEGCYRPIYCGNFKDGRFDGTGIKLQDYDVNLIYSVNNVIEMGMLPTNDVNDYVESISYIGNFSKGNQNGFGMSIKYPDLDAYLNFLPGGTSELADLYLVNSGIELNIGTNKNGELQGDDCYIYSNKYLLYEGDMKAGKMNGDGVEYYSNSDQIKYEGHFRKGIFDGKGVMYDENGKIIYDGKWKNGDYAS